MRESSRPATKAIPFELALARRGLKGFPLVVAAAALLVLMIDGIDIQLLSLVAPVIIEEWGISRAAFGPALAAALIGMTAGSLVGGWIGDRIGRLPALVLSTLLFGGATVLAGFTTQVWTMTALRIVGGIGFGAAGPNAIALASEWVPADRRAQITSLLSIGTPAGGMLGASIVLLFLSTQGWSGTFVICGAGSCLFALALWIGLRESPAYLLSRGDGERATHAARPVLQQGEILAPPGAREGSGEGVGDAMAMSLFDRRLLRLNLGTGVAFFFVALVAYGQLAWTTVMFTSAGIGLEHGVSAIFAYNLCSMTAAILSGFLIRRFGSRPVMLGAMAALAASLVSLWILFGGLGSGQTSVSETNTAIVFVGLCGGTAGAAIAAIYAMMAEGYPQSCRGVGLGLGLTLGRGGGIVLSLVGGLVLDLAAGSAGPFFAILVASIAIAAGGAFISDRHAPPATRAFVKSRETA